MSLTAKLNKNRATENPNMNLIIWKFIINGK